MLMIHNRLRGYSTISCQHNCPTAKNASPTSATDVVPDGCSSMPQKPSSCGSIGSSAALNCLSQSDMTIKNGTDVIQPVTTVAILVYTYRQGTHHASAHISNTTCRRRAALCTCDVLRDKSDVCSVVTSPTTSSVHSSSRGLTTAMLCSPDCSVRPWHHYSASSTLP